MFGGHSGSFYGARSLIKEELAKPENAFVKSLSFTHKSLSDAGLVGLSGKVAAKDADRLINLFAALLKTAAGRLSVTTLRRLLAPSSQGLHPCRRIVPLFDLLGSGWHL